MDSPEHWEIREEKKEMEDEVSSPPPTLSSTSIASPTHEFSFTIPLQHPPPPLTPSPSITNNCSHNASTSLGTFDPSPADEILLAGQIVPLQAMSNTKVSPHNLSSSAENFTLPLDRAGSALSQIYSTANTSNKNQDPTKAKLKSISSLFRLGNWRAKAEETEQKEADNKSKNKKRRWDLGNILRKYIGMAEQILFFYSRRDGKRRDLQLRPHSFSVHSIPRERAERWRKWKGQRSAPASRRASPSNSGHFSVCSINKLSSSSDESTMEELQNAIQAAIAHCKSSIAAKGGQV